MPNRISENRLAANRANAAKSTGPRSPEGKARAAQNARKHGFTASTFAVVRLEDLHEVAGLREDLIHDYQPVNSQELFAIERIALAQQSILRAARLEAALFTASMNESVDPLGREVNLMHPEMAGNGDIEITRAQNRNLLVAEGFQRIANRTNTWTLFLRYQTQAERNYRRAIEEFERLKAKRQELPNEAIEARQPEETESDTDPQPPEAANLQPPAPDPQRPQAPTPALRPAFPDPPSAPPEPPPPFSR